MSRDEWPPPPPPPPRPTDGAASGPSPRLHRLAANVAVVVAVTGAAMWLLSFVPTYPTAEFWPAVVFPAFVAIFPIWGVTLWEITSRAKGRSRRRGGLPIPLRGWRKQAGVAVFVLPWLAFMGVLFSGDLNGQAEQRGDRYFMNNHGAVTEITRDEWLRSRALESRLFGGGVVAFAGLGALYLTQPVAPQGTETP